MRTISLALAALSASVLALGTLQFNREGGSAFAQSSTANNDPKAVMMYNLGITAYRQGSTDAAVIFFKRACDIDENLADAQYNLAVIYQAQHRYKEAIPRFEEVLRIKPNDPDANYQLAMVYADSGRIEEARQHFMAIPPANPHFGEAQKRLATLGQPGAAQPSVAAIQANSPPQQTVLTPANQNPEVSAPQVQQPPTAQIQQPQEEPNGTRLSAGSQVVGANAQPGGNVEAVQPPAQATEANVPTPGAGTAATPVPVLPNISLKVIATGFRAPAGLAMDRNGNLYVANFVTNSIERIAADGTRAPFTSGANIRGPIGLVADDAGNLYVANYNGGTVARINPAGVSTIIAKDLKKPYYLALDREGNLYVSQQEDNSVVKISLPHPTATAAKTP